MDAKDFLASVGGEIRDEFSQNRRVMSFSEYVTMVLGNPRRHARSSPQYLKDLFDHLGQTEVGHPRGTVKRFSLFDCPFDDGRDHLVGHEEVQAQVYRILSNFVREGQANRLILLHGPNGSAKSTFVWCLFRALEHYSRIPEGALYKVNWIFPVQQVAKGGLGFTGSGAQEDVRESYAYLPEEQVEAKLPCDLRDHPIFLIPPARRAEMLRGALAETGDDNVDPFILSDYILYGDLSHRNRQFVEALLTSYHGDYLKVLRHVQVERFYVSPRYRDAAVTVEPQLAVDARAQRLSVERSLSALPAVLQNMSIYEYGGDLVDANRGVIEYSDLLKRPLEAYKYLLGTVETGHFPLENAIIFLDVVFIGSSNEGHLAAFKEIPEFQSFKARMELVRVPYLLDWQVEREIYVGELPPHPSAKHRAPHTLDVAAMWAVLTRLRKPLPEKYDKPLGEIVGKLTPLEKAELYARKRAPSHLSADEARELESHVAQVFGESDAYPNYEGRTGASPREIKAALLNAAQNPRRPCLSPLALFEELDDLCTKVSVYDFLKQEPLPGGYHENRKFIEVVEERYLDFVDDELRDSIGLVEETQYTQLFERYVTLVSHWVKKEKVRNPVTKRMEEPDESLMSEVEKTLGVAPKKEEFRREVIAKIGAWSLDHRQQKPDYAQLFPKLFDTLKASYFEARKKVVRRRGEDLVTLVNDGPEALSDREARSHAEAALATMRERYGYCDRCAREAVSLLLGKRYA